VAAPLEKAFFFEICWFLTFGANFAISKHDALFSGL